MMVKYHMTRELHAICDDCMQACQACIVACQKLKASTISKMPDAFALYEDAHKKVEECIAACTKMITEGKDHLEKCTDQPCIDVYTKCIERADKCIKDCGQVRLCSVGTTDNCIDACDTCIESCDECYESCQEMTQLME
jgi:hypothetical protein